MELLVTAELRLGVETGAGVVEVRVPEAVEPRVVGRPQRVDRRGRRVPREPSQKVVVGGRPAVCRVLRLYPRRPSSQCDLGRRTASQGRPSTP